MKLTIIVDIFDRIAPQRQIAQQIEDAIRSGILQPGQEIPSTRKLATELGLNPLTITRAFKILRDKGLVDHQSGYAMTVKPGLNSPRYLEVESCGFQ